MRTSDCELTSLRFENSLGMRAIPPDSGKTGTKPQAVQSGPSPASSADPKPLDNYRSINAAAEALNRVFKTELIRRQGPWRTFEHVELEVLRWVDWHNTARPHTWCDYLAPAAYEHAYDAAQNHSTAPAAEAHRSLH